MKNHNIGWHLVCRMCIPLVLLASYTFPIPGYADTNKADLTVGMKTIPLLDTKLAGTVKLAILFDPANPDSKQEADRIKAILDGGFQTLDGLKLVGVLVPVDNLDMLRDSKIAVLSSGLAAYYNAINNAVTGNGILTMSTDLGCVRAQKCILGIQSRPRVEIYYSKEAAQNANVVFGQVFSLLVTEI